MAQLLDQVELDQRRKTTPLLWASIGAALAGIIATSFAGAPWLIVIPAALFGLTIGLIWLIWSIIKLASPARHRPRGWIAAGLILAVAAVAIAVNLPVKTRFLLSTRAFNQLVVRAGPPPARLDVHTDKFSGHCPVRVGLYAIDGCEMTDSGYLFFDPLGTGLVDRAGFAYLPNGSHIASEPGLEVDGLVHLQGPWYAFEASW